MCGKWRGQRSPHTWGQWKAVGGVGTSGLTGRSGQVTENSVSRFSSGARDSTGSESFLTSWRGEARGRHPKCQNSLLLLKLSLNSCSVKASLFDHRKKLFHTLGKLSCKFSPGLLMISEQPCSGRRAGFFKQRWGVLGI